MEPMQEKQIKERPYVVIDGMNCFIRFFCANPSCTPSGELIGGVVGFIKFIEFILKTMHPQNIYVVWEKGGGSAKRKALYPEYKANRARIDGLENLNKKSDPFPDKIMDNVESKQKQLAMLSEILKYLPICQVYHAECECDDVLAYMVKDILIEPNVDKIIISSDNDFYQLLDRNDITIYDQGKKIFITKNNVIEKYGVHPRNFALAKTVNGDSSDNITGITGVGFKTLLKAIPEIGDLEKELDIKTLLEFCGQHQKSRQELRQKPIKAHQSILDGEAILKRNWLLMYLGLGTLSVEQTDKINEIVNTFEPKYDHLNFLKLLLKNEISLPIDFNQLAHELKISLLD